MQDDLLSMGNKIEVPLFIVPGVALAIPMTFSREEAKRNILHLQEVRGKIIGRLDTAEALCIGATLLLARKELVHGEYGKFLEEVHINDRTARYYTNIAEFFAGMYDKVAGFPLSKLDALIKAGKETARALIEGEQCEFGGQVFNIEHLKNLTTKELEERVRCAKKRKTEVEKRYEEAQKTHEAEVQELHGRIKDLEATNAALLNKGDDARIKGLRKLLDEKDQTIVDKDIKIAELEAERIAIADQQQMVEILKEARGKYLQILQPVLAIDLKSAFDNPEVRGHYASFLGELEDFVICMRSKLHTAFDED